MRDIAAGRVVRHLIPLLLAGASTAAGALGVDALPQIVGGLALLALVGYTAEALAEPSRRTGNLVALIAVLSVAVLVLVISDVGAPPPGAEAAASTAPAVTITRPAPDQIVRARESELEGTAKNLPTGSVIWLAVRGAGNGATTGLYPASVPCHMAGHASSQWICDDDTVYFGSAESSHRPYKLLALIADGSTQAAIIYYHLKHPEKGAPPWQPEPGDIVVGSEIRVHRAGL